MKKLLLSVKRFLYSVGEDLNAMLFQFMARQGLLLTVVTLPNGSTIHIASGYGLEKDMTAVTNANPGVMTLEASPLIANGDLMEITSGWSKLNGKIVRATGVSGSSVGLENINTSDTALYPAGSGIGSIREISGWTQLQQILQVNSEGGEQQFKTYQFLEADGQSRIPTSKNAAGLKMMIADDPALAGYILAETANDDRLARAIRVTLANGAKIYYNAYVTLNKTPTLTVDEIMACEVTLSFVNPEPVRYTS